MIPRSYLFVPGDRPQLLAKALDRGADALILDLEDGVAAAAKANARATVAAWLRTGSPMAGATQLWVRVNSVPELAEADLEAVTPTGRLHGLVIPKAEDPEELAKLDRQLRPSMRLQPLVESARGVLAMEQLAACPRVERIQLGEADLTADLGMDPATADDELDPIRLQVVVVSAAAHLLPPVGPASADFRNLELFETTTRRLRRLGFGARLTIHPAQVDVVNRVLTPTAEEQAWARDLLDSAARHGTGVFLDGDGKMVDEAVLRSARRILDQPDVPQ